MTPASPPSTAVIRVSRANFDPARFQEVEQMTRDTGRYLIPAIGRLDGLIAYYVAARSKDQRSTSAFGRPTIMRSRWTG
jgi:hypothetical protein